MRNIIGRHLIRVSAMFTVLVVTCSIFDLVPWSLAAQDPVGSSVAVGVHIGNASGIATSCAASGVTHIFLTFTDIQAHQSGKGSAGWLDLTPGMLGGGVQVDLLVPGEQPGESDECLMTAIDGRVGGLPPGKYQQFRISLLGNGSNSTGPESNACASLGSNVFNCVNANGILQPLTVPGGSIRIPSSQIARGGLTISPGQGGIDLDVDINGCASIAVKRKGRGSKATTTFAFKPVLHSGEIELRPLIAGEVVLGSAANGTVSPVSPTIGISGAMVAAERPSTNNNFVEGDPGPSAGATPSVNVEDVIAVTHTDGNGHFVFCPIPLGTYDLVVGSETMPSMANASDATITTGATVTANGGPDGLVIPLLPGSTPAVTLEAQLTSAPQVAAIQFFEAQTVRTRVEAPIAEYGNTTLSPIFTSSDSTGTSGPACAGNQCPAGTDCACVSLGAPADNPVIGPAGGPYAAPAGPALYSIYASVYAGASTCSPTNLSASPEPAPLSMPTLSFVNCQ